MPNYFALYPKDFPRKPAVLQGVDNLMCDHFGVSPSITGWYRDWYNTIGLGLSLGHDWEALRGFFPDKVDVIDWLEANYTTDTWYFHK